jgi:hypothetical protein
VKSSTQRTAINSTEGKTLLSSQFLSVFLPEASVTDFYLGQ